MAIPLSEQSAQLVKTNCKYWSEGSRPMTTPPITAHWAQHPALSLAMDGIAIYANWVSRTVLPIAFQWIHKNQDEICKSQHWKELPDDVDLVIKAAFELVKKEEYYKACKAEFDKFHKMMEAGKLDENRTDQINQTWTDMSRRLRIPVHREFDHELFHKELDRDRELELAHK